MGVRQTSCSSEIKVSRFFLAFKLWSINPPEGFADSSLDLRLKPPILLEGMAYSSSAGVSLTKRDNPRQEGVESRVEILIK